LRLQWLCIGPRSEQEQTAMIRRLASALVLVFPLQGAAQVLNGPDFRVNVATLENQDNARVATNGERFAVVYNRNTSGAVAYLRLFDRAGQPVSGEIALSGLGGSPAVAAIPGGFVVTFAEFPGNILAARHDLSGNAVGAQFRVNQYSTGIHGDPAVAAGPDGGFVVVWDGEGAGDVLGIYAARFDASGTRLADDFLVNTYTTSGQVRPSVAFSGGGDAEFLVAWRGAGTGDGSGIFGRRFDSAGTPVSSEFRVSSATSGSKSYPAASANPAGPTFVVTWEKTENAQTNVFGQRFGKFGLPFGGEFRVNTTTGKGHPSVVIETGGPFIVTYDGVQGQRFSSNGSPAGGEFLLSTATTGANFHPSIASFGPGQFVVCFTNNVRDGSADGVFGQRFGPRGDVDGDGHVNVTDVFYLINSLFAGGPAPPGPSDADSSGGVDVADVFFLINYLFAGGPAPAPF
jgi:serralysin